LLAALGLLAVTAAAAQAGEFKVGGQSFTAKAIASETFEGTAGTSTFTVPSIGLEISCASAKISGTLLLGGTGHESMLFNECKVPGNKQCTVDPIQAAFLSSVVLHAEESWLLFASKAGEPFATILILGELCTLPEKNELTGSFVALVSKSESAEQTISFANDSKTVALFKELGISISYAFGAAPALLSISSVWKLSGANKGKAWGAE